MPPRGLVEYRKGQAQFAIWRDRGLCVFCFFEENKETPYDDVHHVFGRGVVIDWREHYTSLICVCRKHHPQPIRLRDTTDPNKNRVVSILHEANKFPINKEFNLPYE